MRRYKLTTSVRRGAYAVCRIIVRATHAIGGKAVRVWCLRTVYELSGIGFNEGAVLLRREDTHARLVAQAELALMEGMRVVGRGQDGDVMVTGRTVNKKFEGEPLLLEILAMLRCDDADDKPLHRPVLEAQTSRVESVLSWSLPHVIGKKLGDSLYTRLEDDDPNTWAWSDVSRFSTSDFYEEPARVLARCEQVEQALEALSPEHRELVVTALRWWRYGWGLDSSVDEIIAFWVSLECVSSIYGAGDSARSRVLETLGVALPELAVLDGGRALKRLRDIIYNARCAAVHSGKRDVAARGQAASLAEFAATSCIRLAVDRTTTPPPPDHVMTVLLG